MANFCNIGGKGTDALYYLPAGLWMAMKSRFVTLPQIILMFLSLQVRTLFGRVPMNIANHWPVLTSYDDLVGYAASKGGRLPTEPELRLFLDLYDVGFEGGANVGFKHWHPTP